MPGCAGRYVLEDIPLRSRAQGRSALSLPTRAMPESVPNILTVVATIAAGDLVRLPLGRHVLCDHVPHLDGAKCSLLGPGEPRCPDCGAHGPVVHPTLDPFIGGPGAGQGPKTCPGICLEEEPLPPCGGLLQWAFQPVRFLVSPGAPVAADGSVSKCRPNVEAFESHGGYSRKRMHVHRDYIHGPTRGEAHPAN